MLQNINNKVDKSIRLFSGGGTALVMTTGMYEQYRESI